MDLKLKFELAIFLGLIWLWLRNFHEHLACYLILGRVKRLQSVYSMLAIRIAYRKFLDRRGTGKSVRQNESI